MGDAWYFGTKWDAPRVEDAVAVPTPVGQLCLHCEEPIEDGDRGLMTPAYLAAPDGDGYEWVIRPVHLECDLRPIMSHMARQCHCYVERDVGPDGARARSLRDEARATLELLNSWRAAEGHGPI